MTRFNMESLRLGCTEDTLICLAFLNELLFEPIYAELFRYSSKMVQDMWEVVTIFAAIDDAFRLKKKQEHTEKKGREDRSQSQTRQGQQN